MQLGGYARIPVFAGTDAQRVAFASMQAGDLWYATDTKVTYVYDGASWGALSSTASGGSSLSLISKKTLAAGVAGTWSALSGYEAYYLVFDGNVATSGNYLCKVTLNGDTAGHYYGVSINNGAVANYSGSAAFQVGGSAAGVSGSIIIPVGRFNGRIQPSGQMSHGDTSVTCQNWMGFYTAAADVTSISVLLDAGGGSGTAYLYGLKTA